ncbi:unnamed protein product [Camellia sinensis]
MFGTRRSSLQCLAFALTLHIAVIAGEFFKPFNVTYDHRALIIDGKRRMLNSAGIHYPRATPEQGRWGQLSSKLIHFGMDMKQSEDRCGRYDLVKFVKLVGSSGLYLHLRIEGFPVWLRDMPGIVFRTDNAPFKDEMQRFVRKIVGRMREEMLFSWQVVRSLCCSSYGQKGKAYVKWAPKMATGLGAGVPWVMCKQVDAPGDVIPAMNTIVMVTSQIPTRNRQFGRRIGMDGTRRFVGGTNFGRTAGGPNYITSYDCDAPIDEYGLLRQPRWGHLKDLHDATKLCEPALVAVDSPQYMKLGPKQERNESTCSAFLANIDEHNVAAVTFFGQVYTLPPWSVSILPDCRNTVFNTAKGGAQTSIKKTEFSSLLSTNVSVLRQLPSQDEVTYISKTWLTVKEPIGAWGSIYSDDEISFWDENSVEPALTIDSMRDLVRIFINGKLIGAAGHWVKVDQPVQLKQGYNDLVLLSVRQLACRNYGAFLEKDWVGFKCPIKLTGFRNGDIDLSNSLWTY